MTTPRPVAAPDPLADLREGDGAAAVPSTIRATNRKPEKEDPVAAVVRRWHADSTAESLAHRGGTCGCRYLAEIALA